MRRSNLLTLRKFFNWNSSWYNKYSYSDLVLRDTIFNFFLINLFKVLKFPTSMFKIKHVSFNILLIEFDIYICWISKFLKYMRHFTSRVLFGIFYISIILKKKKFLLSNRKLVNRVTFFFFRSNFDIDYYYINNSKIIFCCNFFFFSSKIKYLHLLIYTPLFDIYNKIFYLYRYYFLYLFKLKDYFFFNTHYNSLNKSYCIYNINNNMSNQLVNICYNYKELKIIRKFNRYKIKSRWRSLINNYMLIGNKSLLYKKYKLFFNSFKHRRRKLKFCRLYKRFYLKTLFSYCSFYSSLFFSRFYLYFFNRYNFISSKTLLSNLSNSYYNSKLKSIISRIKKYKKKSSLLSSFFKKNSFLFSVYFFRIIWLKMQVKYKNSKTIFYFDFLYWFFKHIWNSYFFFIHLYNVWIFSKSINKELFIINDYTDFFFKNNSFLNVVSKEFYNLKIRRTLFLKSIIEFKYIYRLFHSSKRLYTNYRFFKYYFFIDFFEELIFALEKTFYDYLDSRINIILLPNIFFLFKPSILSAKLLCDYIFFKLKRKFKPNIVYKTVRHWQVRERSLLFFRFNFHHYMLSKTKRRLRSTKLAKYNSFYSYYASYRIPLQGIRIILSGPPYKARRKIKLSYHLWVANHSITGNMPLQTFDLVIDYFQTFVILKRATLGLKVWILFESFKKLK